MLSFARFAARWRSRARARARWGDLHVIPDVLSPELGNRRTLIVSTPASYGSGDRRYPVLYMQDGQNLFDPRTSFAGDWGLSASLGWASRRGIEPIVVGIYNTGTARFDEYSPFVQPGSGGGGGRRAAARGGAGGRGRAGGAGAPPPPGRAGGGENGLWGQRGRGGGGGGGGGGGAGDRYLGFLTRTVKPLVDQRFRTLPDPR